MILGAIIDKTRRVGVFVDAIEISSGKYEIQISRDGKVEAVSKREVDMDEASRILEEFKRRDRIEKVFFILNGKDKRFEVV